MTCPDCNQTTQHRRGGGACLEAQVAALRAEAGARWARGLEDGLARGVARAERAEARVGVLWRALRGVVDNEDVCDGDFERARAALGEPAEGKDSKEAT